MNQVGTAELMNRARQWGPMPLGGFIKGWLPDWLWIWASIWIPPFWRKRSPSLQLRSNCAGRYIGLCTVMINYPQAIQEESARYW